MRVVRTVAIVGSCLLSACGGGSTSSNSLVPGVASPATVGQRPEQSGASRKAPAGDTVDVLHFFNGNDGETPLAGLTKDAAGNFYGTTFYSKTGYGTVFKLAHTGATWTLQTIYAFNGVIGGDPEARVVFGADGSLYGTTTCSLGDCPGYSHGSVFRLSPPTSPVCHTTNCPWTLTRMYDFTGRGDGAYPTGDLAFDHAGNIYGTALYGGNEQSQCDTEYTAGCGVVFELTPSGQETVLYAFDGNADGTQPYGGVAFGSDGNLYGTTGAGTGASAGGTIFQLARAGSGWTENILHSFPGGQGPGSPQGGVTFDSAGNLWGTTAGSTAGELGTIFELTPSGGSWSFNQRYTFGSQGSDFPRSDLVADGSGNFDGTAEGGNAGFTGSVYEITPQGQFTDLFELPGGVFGIDGSFPEGSVTFDSAGNLYTTASYGGFDQFTGTVFELTSSLRLQHRGNQTATPRR